MIYIRFSHNLIKNSQYLLFFREKGLTNRILFVIITFAEREYLRKHAAMAQLVEHILGKDEVPSSNLGSSSKTTTFLSGGFCFGAATLDLKWVLSAGQIQFVAPALRSKGGIWVCAGRRNLDSRRLQSSHFFKWWFLFWSCYPRFEVGFVRRTNPVRSPRFAKQRRYLGLRRKAQS